MSDIIVQIIIVICGGLSIYLVSRKDQYSKWGFIIGLCGQPFWFYTSIVHKQWGMVILTCFYTYSWSQGIYNYWIKKK